MILFPEVWEFVGTSRKGLSLNHKSVLIGSTTKMGDYIIHVIEGIETIYVYFKHIFVLPKQEQSFTLAWLG